MREFICTDTVRRALQRQAKALCVHTISILMTYKIAYVFGLIFAQKAVHFPLLLSPSIIHGTSSFQTFTGRLFQERRRSAANVSFVHTKSGSHGNERRITIITRFLVIQRNILADQLYELLCFFSGDFANISMFSTCRKKWWEMAQTKIGDTPVR